MVSRSKFLSLPIVGVLLMSGCSTGPNFIAKHEPWREKEERACLASGVVRENTFLHSRSSLGGPSMCGAERPFEMSAAANGRISLRPAALLRCPMIPQVERWVQEVVEPAALHNFGVPLREMTVAASYGCRAMNNIPGGRLSEHGHANALDISAFTLANGRKIKVLTGWNGDVRERAFLRTVRAGACNQFTTVLGPGADRFHSDHFHMDLARHGRDGRKVICK